MLKINKLFTGILLGVLCLPLIAQTPVYDELIFDSDSTASTYKSSGKNYVLVRSKRGNSGLNKTAEADAILKMEVSEIVLVYTETDASAIAEREEANRERWENLLMTYPEFFQYNTSYKNFCQCNIGGDAEALKKVQGFYVYVNGEVPKPEAPKVPEAPPAPKQVKTEEPLAQPTAPATAQKQEEKKTPEKVTSAVPETKPKAEPVAEAPHHEETHAAPEHHEETHAAETSTKKRGAAAPKARRAKNPKACRPACYEGGDEDLYAFFRNSMPLTKKEKKKSKNLAANVKIQLDADGAIKKTMVVGENEKFNKHVEDVIKSMSSWNCAVKNGVAVRSEVRFTVKFDKESKSMKPFDIMLNPKPGPKCKCASDSEIFGSGD